MKAGSVTPPDPPNEDFDPCAGVHRPCDLCGRWAGAWARVPDLEGLRRMEEMRRTITAPHEEKVETGEQWTCTLCLDIQEAGYDTLEVYRWQVMTERGKYYEKPHTSNQKAVAA